MSVPIADFCPFCDDAFENCCLEQCRYLASAKAKGWKPPAEDDGSLGGKSDG